MGKSGAKIVRVEGAIDPGKPGKARFRTVEKDGKTVRIRVIDADSSDFGAQFLSAFRSSVRDARKENQALADRG